MQHVDSSARVRRRCLRVRHGAILGKIVTDHGAHLSHTMGKKLSSLVVNAVHLQSRHQRTQAQQSRSEGRFLCNRDRAQGNEHCSEEQGRECHVDTFGICAAPGVHSTDRLIRASQTPLSPFLVPLCDTVPGLGCSFWKEIWTQRSPLIYGLPRRLCTMKTRRGCPRHPKRAAFPGHMRLIWTWPEAHLNLGTRRVDTRSGYRMYPMWDRESTASQAHAPLLRPRLLLTRSPRTATPGGGTHSTLWRAKSRHALHPGTATLSRRHRPAPSRSCGDRVCTTTSSPPRLNFPSPPRLFFVLPSPFPFVDAPPAPPLPPFICFLVAPLRREARHPAGRCGPDHDRPPLRAIGCPWSRGLSPSGWGHPLVFWSGRHAGWAVFTVFSHSSPRLWVLVGLLSVAK